jgi:hypothetical protein
MTGIYDWVWVFVPLAGIALGAMAIYLEHEKKMALIQKGIDPDEKERKKWEHFKKGKLTGGLIMMGVGAAFLLTGVTVWTEAIPQLYLMGLVSGFVGIALIISYGIEGQR